MENPIKMDDLGDYPQKTRQPWLGIPFQTH